MVYTPPQYDPHAAARLVSRLKEDEQRQHWLLLLERIGIALVIWYAYILLPFDFFDWSWQQFLDLCIIWPGVASIAYFIGGSVHHQSHAADHKASRKHKVSRRPITPSEALELKRTRERAKTRMLERSRVTRQLFRKLYDSREGPVSDTRSS